MRRALQLAQLGRFTVSPNPRVGCVVVQPSLPESTFPSSIIGEGYHRQKGEPHAERIALSDCKQNPQGATLYVNLEPCCHYGSTPPCTDALIESGIHRVVLSTPDPFPHVQGRGIEILQKNGISVAVGVLEQEARYINRFFFHVQETGFPWVILKAAISLDGKLATSTHHSKWITGSEARQHAHEVRAEVDAVLVGVGTVVRDDPSLTVRLPETFYQRFDPDLRKQIRSPVRIVLDPSLRIPIEARMLQSTESISVWLFCSDQVSLAKQKQFEKSPVRVFPVPCKNNRLELHTILRLLAQENIQSVLVEGGPTTHTIFLESQCVNELLIYIAPKLIGGNDAPTFFMGQGADIMEKASELETIQRLAWGNDTLIQGILRWKL